MSTLKDFIKDTRGDAIVVEATILFPIMIMIFAALVMLAMYLPQRTILQEAAQVAASAIATERSDSWIEFDRHPRRVRSEGRLSNVYFTTFAGIDRDKLEDIVRNAARRGIVNVPGEINVESRFRNWVVHQEVIVTVTQEIPVPVRLPIIRFPAYITLTQEARMVVPNGDEFVRNINIARDIVIWLDNMTGFSGTIGDAFDTDGMFGRALNVLR